MTDTKDTITQVLAMPSAGAAFDHLDLHSITPSLTNPRKHFDQNKLQELADSIAASGVHQPILVRPLPPHRVADEQAKANAENRERAAYEIVAGERRWHACGLANVAQVPAMICNMTDAQALEAQVIENLQRADVTELEEAEGYQVLMKHQGINADQLAAKIGKSRAYVYARLKILDLCEEGKEALRTGSIDFSRALLAARIPSKLLQLKAIAYMTKLQGWNDRLPSYRTCAEHVQQEYMLNLDKARFNITDASLMTNAGSCMLCSKRTGANPDLYEDIGSADVCTDRTCFEQKTNAHTAQQVEAAQAKGQTVIFGQEAEDLAVHGYKEQLKGYRRLDALEDSPHDKQTLRKIISAQMEADGILPVKIESPRKKGEFIDVLPNEVVLRLLKTVDNQANASKQVSAEVRAFSEDKKAKAEKKAQAQFEQAWRNQLRNRAWSQLESGEAADAFTLDVHRYLVLRTVHSLSATDAEDLADILNLGRVGAHTALIQLANESATPHFLHMLCVMQKDVSANSYSYSREKNEGLMLVARAVFQGELDSVIRDEKEIAGNKYLQKPEAPKADLPLKPAARAGADSKNGKAKKNSSPAARAASKEQLSTAAATASIAAALQALPEEALPGAAVAAQGNESEPVAADAAQALVPSVSIKRSKLATPPAGIPASGERAEPFKALTPSELLTNRVIVRPNATGKGQKIYIGDEGTVVAIIGPEAVDVSFPGPKGCKPVRVGFHVTELEIAP